MAKTLSVKDSSLTAVADSIRKKTGKTNKLTFPAEFVSEIESITTGGGGSTPAVEVQPSDVNFFDYDGTLIASYTEEQARALTELPTPPEHAGLVFQGWNYTLEEVIANADAADVGALYTTNDGATRMTIEVIERGAIILSFTQTVASGVQIDWGDGETQLSDNYTDQQHINHTYTAAGVYTITLKPVDDCEIGMGYTSPYQVIRGQDTVSKEPPVVVKKINIGNGVTRIESGAFTGYYELETVSMTKNIKYIGRPALQYCRELKFLTIPRGVTTIFADTFNYCYNLHHISLAPVIKTINTAWQYNCSLERIVLIGGFNLNDTNGTGIFSGCTMLRQAVFKSSAWSSLKGFSGNMFYGCSNLKKVDFAGVSTIGRMAFEESGVEELEIPETVTNIDDTNGGYTFQGCNQLRRISLSSGCKLIAQAMFRNCYRLQYVTCNGDVTKIGGNAFKDCKCIKTVDLSHCTAIPTMTAAAFSGTPSDLQILVPAALADEWKAATNWTTYADKIVGV